MRSGLPGKLYKESAWTTEGVLIDWDRLGARTPLEFYPLCELLKFCKKSLDFPNRIKRIPSSFSPANEIWILMLFSSTQFETGQKCQEHWYSRKHLIFNFAAEEERGSDDVGVGKSQAKLRSSHQG
ncbi:hypothetical protein AVEN_10973-1 [Araneus ventricosus]|uniref:Uncharacterized protein n=1 Tax=Araneus ventricosus TaxID=182803 RepID=A0A4Y2JCH9_ARAVE|nr:hypothetical protein AVEN_10973-1 [Araneus ventricosus]